MGSLPEPTIASRPDAPALPMTSVGRRAGAFGPQEWGLVVLVGSLLGSSFFLVEVALRSLPPAVIVAGRLGLGVAILSRVPQARRGRLARSDLHRTWLLGVVWIALPWSLLPLAQRWIASSVAGMISGAMPVFSGLIAALLLRRVPRLAQAAGITVGFGGVAAVAWPALGGARAGLLGVTLAVAASVFYAVGANVAVPLQQRYGSLRIVLHAQRAALVVVAPFAVVGLPAAGLDPAGVAAVVALGALSTVVAFVAMTTLFGRVGADRGSVAIYLVPVFALTFGVAALDETVHLTQVAGTALVIAGAWLTGRRTTRTAQSTEKLDPSRPYGSHPGRNQGGIEWPASGITRLRSSSAWRRSPRS